MRLFGFAILLCWLAGCSATAHLEPDQYLLKGEPTFSRGQEISLDSIFRNPIENLREMGGSTIDPGLLFSSVRTHPNRRMVIPKTYLHLYNLGRTIQKYEYPPETAWEFFFPTSGLFDTIANFLVYTAGEPPVLVDTMQLRLDCENLENVYFSQGFFDAKIYARIDTCKAKVNHNKANVTFVIDEGKGAIIDRIKFDVDSDSIRKILFKTWGDSKLRSGDLYNEDNFGSERNRITTVMRDHGFYTFNPSQISYKVDTLPLEPYGTKPNNPAIENYFPIWITVKITNAPPLFKVGKIVMQIDPAIRDPLRDGYMLAVTSQLLTDSLRKAWKLTDRDYSDSSHITFLTYERVIERLNLNFIADEILIRPGETYSLAKERDTQRRLQALGIFKYVLVNHDIDPDSTLINFNIQTVLLPKYQFKAGFEGFFENDPLLKSNFPGVGGQLGYRDKMVFKGAEKLDLSTQGSLSFFRPSRDSTLQIFWEGTATASLIFPRLIAPFVDRRALLQSNPNTAFSLSLTRQQSPKFYTRNSASLDWSYRWSHPRLGPLASSSLSPYTVSVIQSTLEQPFLDRIREIENDALRTLIIQDYRQRFSSVGRYKFTWSDYMTTRRKPTIYVHPIFEMGGNTPFLIDRFSKIDESWKDYQLGSIFYGQFFKLSVEVKNYLPLTKKSEVVIRNFVGAAKPWNYTPFVPFESRFFSGGTTSMRGWQSNTLGPGTYQSSTADDAGTTLEFLVSPGGEAIFETNVELRTDVYKFLELAFFTDIGNVWFLPGSHVDYEGAKLSRDSYLQMGIDGGIGIRMDFSFFVFRIDVAQQLYSPATQDLVVRRLRDLGGNHYQLNFGIGYPF